MSATEMAAVTPRRSSRIPHNHTPKMSERKKGLFQCGGEPARESLTVHRKLPVLDSESDSEDCDLGIISTLDSSSCDEEQSTPKTPERTLWHETRGRMGKLRENYDLKTFMKSPFMLKKYQNRYSCPDSCGSLSTPATPHFQHHPGTPSSTHSCTSIQTTSSSSSRARKSLASLIADTESCSSSLKDLNFDTDSGTDSKENTPTKSVRRSNRNKTPKLQSFKGVLKEQAKNTPLTNIHSPKQPVVCLTKMDMSSFISPSQILKTPNTTDVVDSPPKLGHNRRSVIEIGESPESTCDSEKSYKRLRNDSLTETGPYPKYPRLENAPKARLSLFNSERLKDILSAKSFYGKSNPELNKSVATKIANAIEVTTQHRKAFSRSHSSRHKRRPGQINLGVRHKIRKPKHKASHRHNKSNVSIKSNSSLLNSTASSVKDSSMLSQNSIELGDRTDPFGKEKQTIEALLSQWEEEDIPEHELIHSKPKQELPCFSKTVIDETSSIFQPITAIPVTNTKMPNDHEAVIVELGNDCVTMTTFNHDQTAMTTCDQNIATPMGDQIVTTSTCDQNTVTSESVTNVTSDVVMTEAEGHEADHGRAPKSGQFLPVAGGYILVEENGEPVQEELPDLDEIERELRMLDEQILKLAKSNNMNPEAVIASTEKGIPVVTEPVPAIEDNSNEKTAKPQKLFPIFSKPNPGVSTPKSEKSSKKSLLKSSDNQYLIDAGQKKFGATQCNQCGAIYEIGNPQDEHDHLVHHNATDVLKFNGWKEECIIERGETWRVLRVRGGESNWRRIETLLTRVIHPQLGYEGPLNNKNVQQLTAYLYIEKKQILGCLIAEMKTRAYKLIPGEPDCCSVEDYPVKCGISRLWTHINFRRRGVAKSLLDCARVSFLYGAALKVDEVAFSAPTASGKAFATKYCGTENFYVYLD